VIKIFGLKTDEEVGKLRKLCNEDLCNLYHLHDIIRLITSGSERWIKNECHIYGEN
jgi:hypothetical protein